MVAKKKKTKNNPKTKCVTPNLDEFHKKLKVHKHSHRVEKHMLLLEETLLADRLFVEDLVLGLTRMSDPMNSVSISASEIEHLVFSERGLCKYPLCIRFFVGVGKGTPQFAADLAVNRSKWTSEVRSGLWEVRHAIAFVQVNCGDLDENAVQDGMRKILSEVRKHLDSPFLRFVWGLQNVVQFVEGDSTLSKGEWRVTLLLKAEPTAKYWNTIMKEEDVDGKTGKETTKKSR